MIGPIAAAPRISFRVKLRTIVKLFFLRLAQCSLVGLALQAAFVVVRSQVGDPFYVYPEQFWTLVSPAGDRTFAVSLGSDSGCHVLSLSRYASRVFDGDRQDAMRGRWTVIPITSAEFSSLRVVMDGDRSWDQFLMDRQTTRYERSPAAQFSTWTRACSLTDQVGDDDDAYYNRRTSVAGEVAYGWPRPAASFAWQDSTGTLAFVDSIRGRSSSRSTLVGRIPTRLYWPGIIVDSLAGGAAVFALAALLVGTQHILRRRRGLCPHCAYDLRGAAHPACPECGAPVRTVPGRSAAPH